MTDKSKDIRVLNTLHSTAAGKKLAYADEVYLDGYAENTGSGDISHEDNVETAIKKLEGSMKSISTSMNDGLKKKADLDDTGKVPSSQLPSYVDDVLEYDNLAGFPTDGESGKIYVAKDSNLTYRWSGTAYVEVSPSLAIGETASTAFAGNRGKAVEDSVAEIKKKTDAIPENPKYTDTTYGEASVAQAGLMSAGDKKRIDHLASFYAITHVTDDGAFKKSADDVKLVFDCTQLDSDTSNHHEVSIGAASADNAGVMTAADKIKLDTYPASYDEVKTLAADAKKAGTEAQAQVAELQKTVEAQAQAIKDLQDKVAALTTQVASITPSDDTEFVITDKTK